MSGFTVALIGADGAGKTTVCKEVVKRLRVPVTYLYMGVNPDASNVMLPTTWIVNALKRNRSGPPPGGPPDPSREEPRPRGAVRGAVRSLRSMAGLASRLAEEWYRQSLAWYHMARGRVVLFDRHFWTDYYAHDIVGTSRKERSLARRIHGILLEKCYPRPDLVILLDAPPEVLWKRKPEGTFEAVARRREEYLQLREVCPNFAMVDATQPREAVLARVVELIMARSNGSKGGN